MSSSGSDIEIYWFDQVHCLQINFQIGQIYLPLIKTCEVNRLIIKMIISLIRGIEMPDYMIKIMRKTVFGFTTRSYTPGGGGGRGGGGGGSTIYVVKTKELTT